MHAISLFITINNHNFQTSMCFIQNGEKPAYKDKKYKMEKTTYISPLFFPLIIKVSNRLEMIILLKNNTRNLKLLRAEIQLKYLIEVHGAMNGNKILSI